MFAHGRWFSLDTLASSTTKTGRHDWYCWNIAESGIKHNKSIKSDLHQWKVVEIIITYMSHYLWFLFKNISVSSRNPVRHGMFAIRAPHFINSADKLNENMWALCIKCQILSMFNLFILIPILWIYHYNNSRR